MKPNLFIVGAPKCGTTSLHYYLEQHPEICMSTIKEPNYFSADEISDLYYGTVPVREDAEYESLFQEKARIIGEASVSYLFYAGIAQRLYHYNNDARILIVLRDPVERGVSHYKMDRRLGFCKVSFDEILDKPERYPAYFRQFVELGDYAVQIKRYLQVFGKDAVKILKYDDMKNDPERFMSDVFEFLELEKVNINMEARNQALIPNNAIAAALYERKFIRTFTKKLMPSRVINLVKETMLRGKENPVNDSVKERLVMRYRTDMKCLSEMVDFDISDWPTNR